MVSSVAGDLPVQIKNNQSVNTAAGNGGQKMSQYSWFTVYLAVRVETESYTKNHLSATIEVSKPLLQERKGDLHGEESQ